MANVNSKKKVYVGMSGGVDSSVSAALLKEAGFDVTGVFIKVWQPDWIECTWRDDLRDAKRVAAVLDIPFITLDLENEYKREVVDYMINEYKKGNTPNPDVMCNRHVKFGGFYDWAMKNGADYIATGHYARSVNGKLYAGEDKNKDQSYFLYTLSSEQIRRTLFPVGNIEKSEVRKLALKFNLPTARKKDSQGLCFIGKVDMKDFLSHYIDQKNGDVLDGSNKIIGEHDGAFFYTIGERHGFNIFKKSPLDKPYYVISKDIDKNTVTVSQKEMSNASGKREVILKELNWISGVVPDGDASLTARTRYREKLQEIKLNGNTVVFNTIQETLSSGQSIVIYDGNVCLGGGVIA